MKLSTRRDTELAADQLFAAMTDFDRIARLLLGRGAAVTRIDPAEEPGTGMGWNIRFDWRGRSRDLRLQVIRFDRPERVSFAGLSDAFDLALDMTVVALSRTRSRLICETDIRPRNMKARLMIQTARLGKAQIDKRYDQGVARMIDELTRGISPASR